MWSILFTGMLSSAYFNVRDAFLIAEASAAKAAAEAEKAGASAEAIAKILAKGPDPWMLGGLLLLAVMPVLLSALLSHTFKNPTVAGTARNVIYCVFAVSMVMSLRAHIAVLTHDGDPYMWAIALGLWLITEVSALVALNIITKTLGQQRDEATMRRLSADMQARLDALEADRLADIEATVRAREADIVADILADKRADIDAEMSAYEADKKADIERRVADTAAALEADAFADIERRAARRAEELETTFQSRWQEIDGVLQARRAEVAEELEQLRAAAVARPASVTGRGRQKEIGPGSSADSGAKLSKADRHELISALLKADPNLKGAQIARALAAKGYKVNERTIQRDLDEIDPPTVLKVVREA
ncbi:hypothetical protein GCM10020001_119570 [Nonomuraea salmonea]